MVADHVEVGVFLGVDVGKGEHHAVALDQAGTRLYDKVLPNDVDPRPGVLVPRSW
jgi:hypothetical protein